MEAQPQVAKIPLLDKVKRVSIEIVHSSLMRYDTCGDWYVEDDTLIIQVAKLSTVARSMSVALHEFVEATQCLHKGITPQMVDDFDLGLGAMMEDPGRSRQAPYHKQHVLAESLEHNYVNHLGDIDWDDYEKEIRETNYGNEART